MTARRPAGRFWPWLFYLTVFVWIVVPALWTVVQSLKAPRDIHTLQWIPWLEFEPTLETWNENWTDERLQRALFNSLLAALGSTVLAMVLGLPAAYALARARLRRVRKEDLLLFFLAQRFLPPVVVVVPLAILAQRVGLYDRLWALIFVHTAFQLPLVILIARGAVLDVPVEIEEAALVDGCSRWGVVWRVVLPVAAPGWAAAALVSFSFSWNEFVAALMLTQYRAQTLPLVVASSEDTWGLDMARVAVRGLMAVIPPLLVGLLVQRFVVRGLTLGAVKG
jgi:multiple sugar transport system permease protein